jgi:molybdate transport system regulatory protein
VKCKKEEIGLEASIWFQKAHNKFLGGDRIALLEKIKIINNLHNLANWMPLENT